jgi:hypothetical protein
VDLVDFLDGWFCSGLGDAAGMASLVVAGQGFPYDFAGPAAPCPKPTEPARLTLRLLTPGAAGATRVELTLVDRRSSGHVSARLVLPPGRQLARTLTRTLDPTRAHRPVTTIWQLPPGPSPAWVRAGVTLDRGPHGVDHLTTRLWLKPPEIPRQTVKRIHLGGLLTLRILVRHAG